MTRHKLIVFATCALAVFQATQVEAQKYRADLGVNGGGSWYSPSLTDTDIGGSGGSLKFKPNWLLGSQATVWLPGFLAVPRFGLRLNLSYTDTDLQQVVESGTNLRLHDHINLWNTTGDLMFGLKQPSETWTGPEFLPYLALGVGMKWVNPGGSAARLRDTTDGDESSGFPITCMAGTCTATTSNPPGGTGTGNVPGRSNFFLSSESGPTLLAGLGGDLRLSPAFAIRIEGGDRLWKAPIHRTDPPSSDFPSATTSNDARVGKLLNELYLQAGATMLVGLSRPAPVAIMPAPPVKAEPLVMAVQEEAPIKVTRMLEGQDSARARAAEVERQRKESQRQTLVLEERVLFAYDRSDLSADARRMLDAKVVIMSKHPEVRLTIAGHADERGTVSYNQELGLRRANALRDYLAGAGLSVFRFDVVSYGKEQPLNTGTSEAEYTLNRRGEFTVLGTVSGFEQR